MTDVGDMRRAALEAMAEGAVVPVFRKERDGYHARWRLASGADNPYIDSFMRSAVRSSLYADAETQRFDTIHDAWLAALRSKTGLVRRDEEECARFAAVVNALGALPGADAEARRRLPIAVSQSGGHLEISFPAPRDESMYRALGQAIAFFAPLRRATSDCGAARGNCGRFSVLLTRDEERSFVAKGCSALASAGFHVSGADISAAVDAECVIEEAPGCSKASDRTKPAKMHLVVRVAGETVSRSEVKFLLAQKSNIVFFRSRWIEVDRGLLEQALRAFEIASAKKLARNEALSFALGIGGSGRMDVSFVRAGGMLKDLVESLRKGVAARDGLSPAGAGYLRRYQREGVAWMRFVSGKGFGVLLADDMGLGKTVQSIAFLQEEKRDGAIPGPALVVAPLGLIANWRREFERFAPEMNVLVHHGENRLASRSFAKAARRADAVIVNYAMLVKDWELFRAVKWSAAVVDEAQTVKNPATASAAAVCAIGAPVRIALTGTPVENSVKDLWSIENFLNPGLLGGLKDFEEDYVKPIAANASCKAAKRLSAGIAPFVLRRLKTDPEVAAELGAKRTVREYCALSGAQREQYMSAVAAYSNGERAKGDMFALLTRLKQVCDGESKLELLCSVVAGIFDAGESALVFTQFVEVARVLRKTLGERFGRPVFFLHGAMSPASREKEVDAFSGEKGPAAFVLSLKAGGFGLNLVKATHVIHYDRWWNPAVEAQATDRAYRIGQRRDVLSHLLIAEGTLEERIDAMLQRKSETAGAIVKSGDSLLKGLSPDELDAIVRLS